MADIINLRDEYIKSIEKKAYEKFRAIPSDNPGFYLVPSNGANTLDIDESFKKSMILRNIEIIETIKNFQVDYGDAIMVSLYDWDEEGNKTLAITNGINQSPKTVTITVKSELEHEDREMIVNMIAYYLKDKKVKVLFFIIYDFKNVETMVKDVEGYYVPEFFQ